VKTSILHVGRALAGVLSAALVGRYGVPVLAGLGGLFVLAIGVICWVVSSEDRSLNLSRILYARRGDRRYLDRDPPDRGQRQRRRSPAGRASGTRQLPPVAP
jgi:hypothetical protein